LTALGRSPLIEVRPSLKIAIRDGQVLNHSRYVERRVLAGSIP